MPIHPPSHPLSIHSPWQPSTHPPISPLIHSSTHSHITPSFIHLFIHPSDTYSLNTHHPSILFLIHPCIHLSFNHPSIQLPTYLSTHWLMISSHLLIQPSIYHFGLYSSKHHPSTFQFIFSHIHPSQTYASFHTFTHLSIRVFIHLSSNLSTSLQSIRSTNNPSICPPTHSPIYTCFYSSTHPTIHLSIHQPSIHQSFANPLLLSWFEYNDIDCQEPPFYCSVVPV